MNSGVSSRGSPMPKSIRSAPAASARRRASSRRTNGYVSRPARTGFSRTARSLQHRVGALQRGDLHVLVALVRLRRVAGAEVDRVEARPRRTPPPASRPAWARARGRRPRPARPPAAPWATGPDAAFAVDPQLAVAVEELGEPGLGLRGRAARRVAEVDVALRPVGDHVHGDAARDPRHARHLDELEPVEGVRHGRLGGERGRPRRRRARSRCPPSTGARSGPSGRGRSTSR